MYFYRQTRAYAHISMLHTKYISCDAWERVTKELNSWIEIKKKCKYLYIYTNFLVFTSTFKSLYHGLIYYVLNIYYRILKIPRK